jgi:hypothetical protein
MLRMTKQDSISPGSAYLSNPYLGMEYRDGPSLDIGMTEMGCIELGKWVDLGIGEISPHRPK